MKGSANSNGVFYEDKYFIKHKRTMNSIDKIKHIVKYLLYFLKHIFQKCIINIYSLKYKSSEFVSKKYPVVLVAIFKNEGRFLHEWIEYHNLIGVDHFYLFNNNSTDNYIEVLRPYVDNGYVSLIDWPNVPGQVSAYQYWWDNYKNDCGYAAFIDIDEFICPYFDSNIKSWLQRYAKYPIIKMDWKMFGTSSHLKHDDNRLVIEQYDSCWSKRLSIGKVIFNCHFNSDTLNKMSHHMLHINIWNFRIDPFNDTGKLCQWEYLELGAKDGHTIQLNHYYSKAFDILKAKIEKGSVAHKNNWKAKENYFARENMNKSKDFIIQRFLLELKLKMNNIDL